MGWTLATTYDPANEHNGFTVMVLDDDTATSKWTDQVSERVTGWRAGCDCGWSGMDTFLRTDYPSEHGSAPKQVEQFLGRAWQDHVHSALPELRLHNLASQRSLTDAALDSEVQTLRLRSVPWEKIGAAMGISRQSAWERWKHLDLDRREHTSVSGPAALSAILPALDQIDAVVGPHLAHDSEPDPAVLAIWQTALGLRRLVAPANPAEAADAVSKLEAAAQSLRHHHATELGLEALAAESSKLRADSFDLTPYELTVDAADFEDEPSAFTVAMQGSASQPMTDHVLIDGRLVTDPAVYADIVYALELLGEAAGKALYTDIEETA
ncbi:hypothetical protein [Nocardiopsis sp. JB363]|uniref:hypothetical protein n=1 Tax=Nocardiopsis sp. JB363 TaxID=1434837 RepID=UPI00097B3FF7|nr:hypothetical protein [Nocardiopsis sp. JB363]SIO84626.1 hypothetical protein BQ8420_02860 [Nocardiopsis sp. JB363]